MMRHNFKFELNMARAQPSGGGTVNSLDTFSVEATDADRTVKTARPGILENFSDDLHTSVMVDSQSGRGSVIGHQLKCKDKRFCAQTAYLCVIYHSFRRVFSTTVAFDEPELTLQSEPTRAKAIETYRNTHLSQNRSMSVPKSVLDLFDMK